MAENEDVSVEDRRIAELEHKLQQRDDLLHKAGELGKNLLEQNADLQKQIDAREREFGQKFEVQEQEIHALQKTTDQKANMERIYLEEIESVKSSLESMRRQQEFDHEAEQVSKLIESKKKNEALRMEIDRLSLAESQMQQELASLNGQLTVLKEELANQKTGNDETCSDEMARLLSELQSERDAKDELRKSVNTLKNTNQQLALAECHLKQEVTSVKEEVIEKECQITSYQNALEKSREECTDLQVQLDVQRMETMDKANKGNSLFSEVEDRRIQAELELSKLRVQFDSIKKKHTMVAQQMHRYQSQVLIFMQSATSQIDESRLKKLEKDVYVARQQIQQLTRDNNELKKRQTKLDTTDLRGLLATAETLTEAEVNDFMLVRLENKGKELDSVRKQLSSEKFKRMSFETSLMERESELYEVKKRLKSTEAANMKVKLEIEKMKLKYEPDSLNVGNKIERRHVETIPLCDITDKQQEQGRKAERRYAVSSLDNINKSQSANNRALDVLNDILSAPTPEKRLKVADDSKVAVVSEEIACETESRVTANENESRRVREQSQTGSKTTESESETKEGRGQQVEHVSRTVRVTGENPEQCKQQ